MSKQTEKFLRVLLPTIDTRQRITIFSKLQLLQDIKLSYIASDIYDEIIQYSVSGDELIHYIVTPVEDIFKTRIEEKEFVRLFLKYIHVETIRQLKNPQLLSLLSNVGDDKRFLLSLAHLDLNGSYRKWQIDNLIKDL